MGLYKQEGSPFWNYRFSLQGTRISGSTKVKDRKLAQKVYEHERAQYVLGEKTHEVRPIKLKELIADYLEYSKANKRSYRDDISLSGRVLAYFGDCMASEVTQQSIERYKAVRREKKVAEHLLSGSTINRELAFLKVVFSKAVVWKKAQHNPVLGVRFFNEREKARVRYLSQAQQENLLGVCPPELRRIVLIALRTGMRQSEILSIRWRDVDPVTNQVTIPKSKGGGKRYIPLHGDVAELLSQMPRTGEYVFQGHGAGPVVWDGALRTAWEKSLATAGIQDFRFHDLRHTTASQLAMRGASLQAIAAILGHSSTRMAERYAHLSPAHISATLALLPSLSKKAPGNRAGKASPAEAKQAV
jgi:integrase